MSVRNGNTITGTYRTSAGQERGSRYLDGLVLYTGFCTIMPPNAPNCVSSNTEIYCAAYSASSNHSGGVNCGFVDGSIHFVSETVDTNGLPDSKQGNKLMGTSSYGVWDAMGTPSGGESKFVL